MFFTNSRTKFKSKPSKCLSHCLKFICLIVFLILLITQLRATELPAGDENGRRGLFEVSNGQRLNDTSSRGNSIDRDDHAGTYEEPADATPTKPIVSTQTKLSGQEERHSATIQRDESAPNPRPANSGASPAGLDAGEDLFVSSATAQLQTAPPVEPARVENDEASLLATDGQQTALPSLAEMTAAGTAAGILVQDLMAQANMEDKSASQQDDDDVYAGPAASPFSDDAQLTVPQMQQIFASNQNHQKPQLQDQSALQRDDDNDEGTLQSDYLGSTGRPQVDPIHERSRGLSRAEAVNRLNQAATGPSSDAPDANETPEPSSEEASPDSIESLMGAEGTQLDTDEDGQEQASVDGQPPPLQSDSNLVHSNMGVVGLVSPAQQLPGPDSRDDGDEDEDSDDDNGRENRGSNAQGSQLHADHIEHHDAAPIPMNTRYEPIASSASARFGSQLEHNLVAPMRESLVDLNTAAGHYYGKKKKKKVKKVKKKIIIKKKKKKKMKHKKVKIYKMKKKKKIKKPKKHHHHHHHHHGKYYM